MSKNRCDFLSLTTFSYLALPWFIFCWGWMHWPLALFCTVGLILVLIKSDLFTSTKTKTAENSTPKRLALVIICTTLATLWVMRSGIGAYAYQNADWDKHNSFLIDLTVKTWPPLHEFSTPIQGQTEISTSSYYIAYYLSAAAIGKIAGSDWTEIALLLISIFGVTLALMWVARLTGNRYYLPIFIFLLLSGLDYFATCIKEGHFVAIIGHKEWWSRFADWQYSSNASLLTWVPQHGISAWLGTALCLHEIFFRRSSKNLGLIAGVCILWSPFTVAGLLPLALFALLTLPWRTYFNRENIAAVLIFGTSSALYLFSNKMGHPSGPVDMSIAGSWWNYVFFMTMEIWLLVICQRRQTFLHFPRSGVLLAIIFAILSLMPFYRYGNYNDLIMRGSLPMIFALWIFTLISLTTFKFTTTTDKIKWIGIILLIIGGAFNAACEMRALHPIDFDFGSKAAYRRTSKMNQLDPFVSQQYIQRKDSIFYLYLQKKVTP